MSTKFSNLRKNSALIIELIKEKFSINQTKIGKRIGLSNAQISRIKKGESEIGTPAKMLLEREFGVNPKYLTSESDEPFLTLAQGGELLSEDKEDLFSVEQSPRRYVQRKMLDADSKKRLINHKLRAIRDHLGVSIRDWAHELGYSEGDVYDFEQRGYPLFEYIRRVQESYKINSRYFFKTDENRMFESEPEEEDLETSEEMRSQLADLKDAVEEIKKDLIKKKIMDDPE